MNGISTEQHQSIMTSGNGKSKKIREGCRSCSLGKSLFFNCDKTYSILAPQALNGQGQLSNDTASVLQQQSYYSAAGNAHPPGTGQQNLQPTTNNQQMIQRIPQPNDSHFTNQPVQQMNHPQ